MRKMILVIYFQKILRKKICYDIIAAFKMKGLVLSKKDLLVEVGVCPLFNIAQKKLEVMRCPVKLKRGLKS